MQKGVTFSPSARVCPYIELINKLMKKIFLLLTLAFVISLGSCSKDNDSNENFTGVVTVSQKGTLKSLLQKYGLMDATQLTIAGTLGDADFETLIDLSIYNKLASLDLSDVDISILPTQALWAARLTSIILPENLEEIGLQALAGTRIEMITIPSSVLTIGERAFDDCKQLRTVVFSSNARLRTIAGEETAYSGGAFSDCEELSAITIPASVEFIGERAFLGCTSLRTITFQPNSRLKTIGNAAFITCPITSIEVPASVERLESTFVGCTSLESVRFQANSQLRTIGATTFQSCPLETLDASNCAFITSIGTPNGNMDLKTVNIFIIGTKIPPHCNFLWLNSNATLRVPTGCVNAYKNADGWKNFTYISE